MFALCKILEKNRRSHMELLWSLEIILRLSWIFAQLKLIHISIWVRCVVFPYIIGYRPWIISNHTISRMCDYYFFNGLALALFAFAGGSRNLTAICERAPNTICYCVQLFFLLNCFQITVMIIIHRMQMLKFLKYSSQCYQWNFLNIE